MDSESARRERRMGSARGRVHLTSGRARAHAEVSGVFFLYVPSLCGVKKIAFLSGFAEQLQLSSNIVEMLKEQAFDRETALLGLSEGNLKEMEGLKLGDLSLQLMKTLTSPVVLTAVGAFSFTVRSFPLRTQTGENIGHMSIDRVSNC